MTARQMIAHRARVFAIEVGIELCAVLGMAIGLAWRAQHPAMLNLTAAHTGAPSPWGWLHDAARPVWHGVRLIAPTVLLLAVLGVLLVLVVSAVWSLAACRLVWPLSWLAARRLDGAPATARRVCSACGEPLDAYDDDSEHECLAADR